MARTAGSGAQPHLHVSYVNADHWAFLMMRSHLQNMAQGLGMTVWPPVTENDPGHSYRDCATVTASILRSDAVLVLLSSHYLTNSHVADTEWPAIERLVAREANRGAHEARVYILVLDTVVWTNTFVTAIPHSVLMNRAPVTQSALRDAAIVGAIQDLRSKLRTQFQADATVSAPPAPKPPWPVTPPPTAWAPAVPPAAAPLSVPIPDPAIAQAPQETSTDDNPEHAVNQGASREPVPPAPPAANLAGVFAVEQTPDVTFVEPRFFDPRTDLPLTYRDLCEIVGTNSFCLTLEGPIGSGKTTAVLKALEAADRRHIPVSVKQLCAGLPPVDRAVFVLDGFDLMPDTEKLMLQQFLVDTWGSAAPVGRLVIVGTRVRSTLLAGRTELHFRVRSFAMTPADGDAVTTIMARGAMALNITFPGAEQVLQACRGSFQLVQLFFVEACRQAGIRTRYTGNTPMPVPMASIDVAVARVGEVISPDIVTIGAIGGRSNWAVVWLLHEIGRSANPQAALSCIDDRLLLPDMRAKLHVALTTAAANGDLPPGFWYDAGVQTLGVDDPKVWLYLRHQTMDKLAEVCGKDRTR